MPQVSRTSSEWQNAQCARANSKMAKWSGSCHAPMPFIKSALTRGSSRARHAQTALPNQKRQQASSRLIYLHRARGVLQRPRPHRLMNRLQSKLLILVVPQTNIGYNPIGRIVTYGAISKRESDGPISNTPECREPFVNFR